jgi:hypothetical protein
VSNDRIIRSLLELTSLMQATDANEFVIEMGLDGGAADGTRYLVHIIRQCPEEAVEEGEEKE